MTGGSGQPGCTHNTVERVGNCSSRQLSVCIPPNTPANGINRFCDDMCATHARSAAVTTGFIGGGLCPLLTARGISVPKASGMGFTWEFDCHLYYRRAKLLALALGSARRWKHALIARLSARAVA